MEKIVIVGTGETAHMAHEYFTYDSPHEVVAFAVERPYIEEGQTELLGLPLVAFEEVEQHYPPSEFRAFVAMSSEPMNQLRARLYAAAKRKGYSCISYVSSRAFVWHNVEIGENCFIFENNVVQHGVRIGNNVILWSGNHIGHQTVIEDNVFISSHVVVSGFCRVGRNSFLGVNSGVGDKVLLKRYTYLAMGAHVHKKTDVGRMYKGTPGKPDAVDVFQKFNIADDEPEPRPAAGARDQASAAGGDGQG